MRFIPARAGNTWAGGSGAGTAAVHPRACGEHEAILAVVHVELGSSPRVRGTRHHDLLPKGERRFIPARAGNTRSVWSRRLFSAVHPRACGEHACHVGASESGRRFIPARAGNTRRARGMLSPYPVHPRACGEHGADSVTVGASAGSSPRVRGTH